MKQQKTFIVDTLFILSLFILFTISALLLVSIGAEAYRKTTKNMSDNYATRTSIAYITEKVRHNDCSLPRTDVSDYSGIDITTLNGTKAFVLTQEINDQDYCTYLYLHDGYLKELIVKAGTNLGEQMLFAGQNVMELKEFDVNQVSDHLFSITLTSPNDQINTLFLSTHCD